MLDPADWQRVDALLQGALDQPERERERWLEQACGGDRALVERVSELVRLAETDDELLRPGGILLEAHSGASPGTGHGNGDAGSLPTGHKLGRYEILGMLGAGGMGHVYRALDPALEREVAIKALARAFHDDAASLRRFEREARVLATLSHPNIAAIYGFEVLEGAPYLILERIEGETLADRLRRGALPLAEAIPVAVQVAEGLEEAHAKGVTHRDLKPSNVMLAVGGRVKLVDFGLAKAASTPRTERRGSPDPTTASGAVIGTAPYMSPEQVHGQDVDTRTDVWAFGCVFYEMLAGRRAFQGRSLAEILAAVLRDEPDWAAVPDHVPWALHRLLRRCLRKDTHARLQHIGDARVELKEIEEESPAPRAPGERTGGRVRVLPWALATVFAAAMAVFAVRAAHPPAPVVRLSLELPRGVALASDLAAPFALAPAGTPLVFEGREGETTRLYVRDLDTLAVRPLAGTEGARQPFFSPDGRWVGFFADRKLKKVPLDGGPVLPVADVGGNPRGAAWAPDGSIIVAPSQTSGLIRLVDGGNRQVALTTVDTSRGEFSHRWPEVLPGGRWVLFTAGVEEGSFDEARLEAVSLESGERRFLLAGAGFGRCLAGRLAFVRAGRVHAVAFDLDRLQTRGEPAVVLEGVRYDPRNGGTHLVVSASGSLVYDPSVPLAPETYLSWLDRDGRLIRLVDTPRLFRGPRLDPGGRRVAVAVGTAADSDLWLVDSNATMSRLSFGLSPHQPAWTPDGRAVAVGAEQRGSWRLLAIPAGGEGSPRVLLEGPHRMYPNAWSPDGRHLVFQEHNGQNGWDLLVLPVDPGGQATGPAQPLAETPFHETRAALSADGRWVAYESDELDGIVHVYVRSFPEGGRKVRVSMTGARSPCWGGRGELYYWDTTHSQFQVVRLQEERGELLVKSSQPWAASGQTPPSAARVVVLAAGARFGVHPSGNRLLVLETSTPDLEPSTSRPVIVLGWADELRARVR